MKYYYVMYIEKLPDKFGGIAQGPLIKLRSKYKDDTGLIEHEKTHVHQWYFCLAVGLFLSAILTTFASLSLWPLFFLAPFLHQLLYRFVRPYRCWCEIRAYRKQIAVGGYTSNDAATALADKYDLKLSADKARSLLFN